MASTWVDDIRTWPAPQYSDDGVSLLIDTLSEVADGGKIATPSGLESAIRMPLDSLRILEKAVEIVGDGGLVAHLRLIKSDAEIEKIQTACAIAMRAFDRVGEIARVGAPLDAVFRKFQMRCLDEGADSVSYLAGGAGPNGYEDVISPAHSTALNSGDILMLDTGVVWDGYFCDFDRNFAIGPAQASTVAGTSPFD